MARASAKHRDLAEMTILIDKREKHPWEFPTPYTFSHLKTGDYTIQGQETRIAIERKAPCELFTCFGSQRDRFQREYERLSSCRYAAVMIEGTLEDCAMYQDPYSQVSPHVIIASLIAWESKYRVRYHFATNRLLAQTLAYRIMSNFFIHQT